MQLWEEGLLRFSPRPGQNLVSDATFRSVLEMEMGSLGSATAETRSRSLVVVRILHFRIVGCFSPTAQKQSHRRVKRSETPAAGASPSSYPLGSGAGRCY